MHHSKFPIKYHHDSCLSKVLLVLTLSGIHIIFVVGYGWSNVLLDIKSDVSSSRLTICTCVNKTVGMDILLVNNKSGYVASLGK